MNQNALELLKEFPAATKNGVLAGNYAVNPETEDSNHQGDIRIDQYIDNANTMFGRFSSGQERHAGPGTVRRNHRRFASSAAAIRRSTCYSGALSWTRIYHRRS
jgi:hypothetical protein